MPCDSCVSKFNSSCFGCLQCWFTEDLCQMRAALHGGSTLPGAVTSLGRGAWVEGGSSGDGPRGLGLVSPGCHLSFSVVVCVCSIPNRRVRSPGRPSVTRAPSAPPPPFLGCPECCLFHEECERWLFFLKAISRLCFPFLSFSPLSAPFQHPPGLGDALRPWPGSAVCIWHIYTRMAPRGETWLCQGPEVGCSRPW